jgi:hypothetical protein
MYLKNLICFFLLFTEIKGDIFKKYEDYYYYQRLDLIVYNDSSTCNYPFNNNYGVILQDSYYYFKNCNCDLDDCRYNVFNSYDFSKTNFSLGLKDYNLSECLKDNNEYLGELCITCFPNNNTLPNIYIDGDFIVYNYYCILSKLIMIMLILTCFLSLIVLAVKKNEKKIILYKKKRTYSRI